MDNVLKEPYVKFANNVLKLFIKEIQSVVDAANSEDKLSIVTIQKLNQLKTLIKRYDNNIGAMEEYSRVMAETMDSSDGDDDDSGQPNVHFIDSSDDESLKKGRRHEKKEREVKTQTEGESRDKKEETKPSRSVFTNLVSKIRKEMDEEKKKAKDNSVQDESRDVEKLEDGIHIIKKRRLLEPPISCKDGCSHISHEQFMKRWDHYSFRFVNSKNDTIVDDMDDKDEDKIISKFIETSKKLQPPQKEETRSDDYLMSGNN